MHTGLWTRSESRVTWAWPCRDQALRAYHLQAAPCLLVILSRLWLRLFSSFFPPFLPPILSSTMPFSEKKTKKKTHTSLSASLFLTFVKWYEHGDAKNINCHKMVKVLKNYEFAFYSSIYIVLDCTFRYSYVPWVNLFSDFRTYVIYFEYYILISEF